MQDTFDIFNENTTTAHAEAKPVKLSKEEARAKAQEKADSITSQVAGVLCEALNLLMVLLILLVLWRVLRL